MCHDQRVELYDYWVILRTRIRLFAVVVILAVGITTVVCARATPSYSTRATVYFNAPEGRSARDLNQGLAYAQALIRAYAEAATEPIVLDPVIRRLGLGTTSAELAKHVEALAPLGTVLIQVRATDRSADVSAAIATEVAAQLAASVEQLTPVTANRRPPVEVSIIATAGVPTAPSYPQTVLSIGLALVLGILAAFALCVWLDGRYPRVRSRRDVAKLTALPVLGFVPVRRRLRAPWRADRRRERLAQLGTNFRSLQEEHGLRSVLFVAAADGNAVRRATAELGTSLRAHGSRVLLIDADLRAGSSSGADGAGLSTVLRGQDAWRDAVVADDGALALLPAGPPLHDPGAALESSVMRRLLWDLGQEYGALLIRSAPVLRSSDGLALSGVVDGVVLVSDRKGIRRALLDRAISALSAVRAPLRGLVLGD
jgi:capsular polysaccharide biosynthesis protein/Mrp family chromosome partitioning ATPase